ncbi:hypothetical protein D6D01_04930 [Aureobasidium pullulans]|uniref:Uncharacterized protein n=1 Tax=Aureobasidium pullulans TaxID=5580 RepID=A0A4S9LA35_AURPU|nr:hypothetical protein D6D01_04930 [Aureobasidium pullulans]
MKRVDSLKGSQRPPQGRQARENLLAHGAISSLSNADIKMTVISESYSPSIAPLQTPNKINLRDLNLETHHRGNLLVLRTFGHSTDVAQIQTFMPVEDETGDVDRIAIFNFSLSSWPEKRLPSGIVLVIKEPFYSSVSEDMGMALCIHHPSDLPIQAKTASEWKLEGNEALKKKDSIKANHCYSKGLAVVHDIDLKFDLLRNRSQARLFLGNYEAAKEDAVASTQDTTRMRHEPKYSKGLYRAGRAAYELSDYNFALKMFQRLVDAFPSDQDGLKELERTRLRMQEAQNGVFESDHVAIWVEAVRKAFHNPSLSHHITGLSDGTTPSTESDPLIVDDMLVIDVFRMQNIIEHAAFGFTADEIRIRKDVQKAFKADSSGVWPVAARMNHSCLFNASRGFVGDFMIVRASKDILQNEEVTVMFCPAYGNFEQLQQNLEGWGICCDCRLCKAEGIIELLPTFGMVNVHEWLMFAHYRQPPRALDYAHFVLMDHGYKVTIQASGISLDRTNYVLSMAAVKAMQYIEHYYTQTNVEEVAKSARALAEEMHVTDNGSMIGYQGWS